MYIALQRVTTPEKVFEPGDEIPEFESWAEVPKRALLNLKHVEHSHEKPGKRPKGRLKTEIAAEQEAEAERLRALARENGEEEDGAEDDEEPGTDDRNPDEGVLYCEEEGCEEAIFANPKALEVHRNKAHK
jgi:hypothetical protein